MFSENNYLEWLSNTHNRVHIVAIVTQNVVTRLLWQLLFGKGNLHRWKFATRDQLLRYLHSSLK